MGIDLSLQHTGIVILSEYGSLLRTFSLDYVLARKKKNDPPISEAQKVERLINLTNDVVKLAKDFKVRHVALEGYAYQKANQAHQIGEIGGNVKVHLWLARNILVVPVPPSTGRKHFFDYGHAAKEDIMKVLTEGLGLDLENDHEADAYVVARYLWDFEAVKEKEFQK